MDRATGGDARRLCGFLGVDPLDDWSRASQVKNASRTPRSPWLNAVCHDYLRRTGVGELLYHLNFRKGYPEMDADTRRFLLNVFIEDIHETEEIVGRDLDTWIDEIDLGAET